MSASITILFNVYVNGFITMKSTCLRFLVGESSENSVVINLFKNTLTNNMCNIFDDYCEIHFSIVNLTPQASGLMSVSFLKTLSNDGRICVYFSIA